MDLPIAVMALALEGAIEGSKRTQDLITVEGFLGHCCGD